MSNPAPARTIGDLLASARGSTDSLDARLLLSHVLACPATTLFAHPEHRVAATDVARFEQLLARRSAGEPLAYLTGEHEFWGLPLQVTPATLDPRPDTETLVQAALDCLAPGPAVVADLGTGTGAVALALAWERPRWQLHASDCCPAALAVAEANAGRVAALAAAARRPLAPLSLYCGDWLAALPPTLRLDAIVSNPPYLASTDPHLPALAAEPLGALVSGADGLAAIRTLCRTAPGQLQPGGWLLLEHGADQAAAVQALLAAAGFSNLATRQDLAGCDRVSLGQQPA